MNALPSSEHFLETGACDSRFREAGEATLDRVHHDGRVDDRWLALNLHEFTLLWRLAAQPGQTVSGEQLLIALQRLRPDCETGVVADYIADLRHRLASVGLAQLVVGGPDEGYRLDVLAPPSRLLTTGLDRAQPIGQSPAR